jgi:quercetin dioxygenase-like cupin family protein
VRYVRPFSVSDLKPASIGPVLVAPEEGLGVSIRLRRGGSMSEPQDCLRGECTALVLMGEARLSSGAREMAAREGSLIFLPSGSEGGVSGTEDSVWMEIVPTVASQNRSTSVEPRVIAVDASRFEGTGFAYQSMLDRSTGSESLRLNVLQVQPGAGSPDYHIHAFAQLYVILEGEMTIDVGRARMLAARHSLVCLPPGVVHRNFNASSRVERHISLLVPEPAEGEVFDYAVDIHPREAELLTAVPTL